MAKKDAREEEVFLDALDCDSPDALAALLNDRCAGDAKLHARIVALLRHHKSQDRILDESTPLLPTPVQANELGERVGSTVGRYKLLEQIGEGGMGVVYMAEQDSPVRRKVAIKIIKLGMDTKNVVARFESERQAVAMMDHPTIAKALDAGATRRGRPYFAMELVRGTAITEFCDKHHLALRQRLQLFVQVCNGIHHAHQKGIIHRDIKPSNVMITSHDGEPLPKIIDFGIAKATNQRLTEKTLFTRYGDMIGTPAYMSPEQSEMCDGDVDTRSDIYSLGVLLYELLTGTTPFDMTSKSYRDIQNTIKHQEPECPSTRVYRLAETCPEIDGKKREARQVHRFIRGDLDCVVMRCLSKDRTRRYETARDLGRDVQRFLAGDPIEAAAPSVTYRLRKYFVKHRAPLTAVILVVLALVAGTIVSSVFAVRAYDSAKRAREAEQLAQLRLEETQSARLEAERERDRAVSAEQRLAELNHQQRNRAAFYKAVAKLNPAVTIEGTDSRVAAIAPVRPTESARLHPGIPMLPATGSVQLAISRNPSLANSNAPAVTVRLGDEQATLMNPSARESGSATRSETDVLQALLQEQRTEFGGRDLVVANTLDLLGKSYMREKRYHDATLAFRECQLIRSELKATPKERAEAGFHLGKALMNSGKPNEARYCLTNALNSLPANALKLQQLRQAIEQALVEASDVD